MAGKQTSFSPRVVGQGWITVNGNLRAQISPLCWWWVFVLTLLTKCPVGISFCGRPVLAFELQQL